MEGYVLEARNVVKRFEGVTALKGVTLRLRPGTVHGLVGENGAGKSTLTKIISGVLRMDDGELVLRGQTVTFAGPADALRQGIAMVPQELAAVPEMTVAENIALGMEPRTRYGVVDRKAQARMAEAALQQLGVALNVKNRMRSLSTAQKQLVEIAKAIARDARVILMDEPTSALGPHEVEGLFRTIRYLREQGYAIVYISHKLDEVLTLSDEISVLRDGAYVGSFKPGELTAASLASMMVGRELELQYPRNDRAAESVLMSVRGLTNPGSIHDVTFDLHVGEVLGVFGLLGSGKTELLRALFGADRAQSGQIVLDGRILKIRSPRGSIASGVAFVTEERKRDGLFLPRPVRENISVASLESLVRGGVISRKGEKATVEQIRSALAIKMSSTETAVSSLSGGNQQKVVLGRWLLRKPRLLLLDEPTRGVDVGAKRQIYELIIDFVANQGSAAILASAEPMEVLEVCNRVLVLHKHRIVGVLSREEATEEKLMALATGEASVA